MKLLKLMIVFAIAGAGLFWVSAGHASSPEPGMVPDQALTLLMKGNDAYVKGNLQHLAGQSKPKVRSALAEGQKPYAIVLSCSDSSGSPETWCPRMNWAASNTPPSTSGPG